MWPEKLRGVFTALVTPFGKDGEVDFEAYERLINYQIEGRVAGIVPCGTTGESPTLAHAEHVRVIEMAVRFAKGRLPVIAGTGSNSTAEAVALTQAAKDCGADGVLVVSPYYNKPMPSGFRDYYGRIAAVGLPVILYDIPGRTAKGVPSKVIIQLMAGKKIAGMKWASGDFDQATTIKGHAPKDFSLLSGDDNLTVPLIGLGGDGVISVLSNLCPEWVVAMVNEALSGSMEKAERMHKRLLPLMKGIFIETNPIPVKEALAMVYPGTFHPYFRSPMMPLEDGNREKLRQILADYELVT